MAVIAAIICSMVWAPASDSARASVAKAFARCAFSAVARIMLDISSSEVLVSSTEDACSLDPEESWLLAMDTWRDAEAVCMAPWSRSAARDRRA